MEQSCPTCVYSTDLKKKKEKKLYCISSIYNNALIPCDSEAHAVVGIWSPYIKGEYAS